VHKRAGVPPSSGRLFCEPRAALVAGPFRRRMRGRWCAAEPGGHAAGRRWAPLPRVAACSSSSASAPGSRIWAPGTSAPARAAAFDGRVVRSTSPRVAVSSGPRELRPVVRGSPPTRRPAGRGHRRCQEAFITTTPSEPNGGEPLTLRLTGPIRSAVRCRTLCTPLTCRHSPVCLRWLVLRTLVARC
jgi:hypothetical protein